MGILRRAGLGAFRNVRNDVRRYSRRRRYYINKARRESARRRASRRWGPGCTIAHRSRGASERCPNCRIGRENRNAGIAARKAARQAAMRRFNERLAAIAARQALAREAVSEERWQELLAPDGTPTALALQRRHVRSAVARAAGIRPYLKRVTTGQAENILRAFNQDPAALWKYGRGQKGINVLGIGARWFLT